MSARRRGKGEGTYYTEERKLADGRSTKYVVHVVSLGYDERGRRVRRKFVGATRAEAKAKADLARKRAAGAMRKRATGTVGEYLESWLAEVARSKSKRTAATYAAAIERFAIPNIGRVRLEEVGQEHIGRLYETLEARGHTADSVQKLHKALRRAFNVAIGKGLLARNPVSFVERRKHRSQRRKSYSADEVARFLTAARGARLEAMFRLAIVGAMRPGELYALERADVDLERGHLDVRQNLEDVGGKLALVPAKADSARRIPLTPATVEALREHLARMDAEKHRPSPYVFVGERGKWIRVGRANQALREVCEAAGLPVLTMYELRHTAISLFGEAGVHLRVAADVAGHADTTITADVYTHAGEAMHRDGVERVEAMIRTSRVEPIVEPIEASPPR